MKRLGLLASGGGGNVAAILDAIEDGQLKMEPAIIICDRRGAGVMDVAASRGVPVELIERSAFSSRQAQHGRILRRLHESDVDFVALAGFLAILDPEVVRAFEGRILNTHPSLLPAFAGIAERQRRRCRRG